MRSVLLALAAMTLAVAAYAAGPVDDSDFAPGNGPDPDAPRDIFHCQDPTSGFWTTNSSTGFDSEMADDIPDEFDGRWVNEIVVYVGEWGATWMDPAGIIVNLYDNGCPPPLDPYDTLYFTWGDPTQMEYVFVNDQPSSYDLRVTLFVDPPFQITSRMSLGFVMDNTWGTDPPYCGVDYTEDYDIYGCGEFYWDGEYWGYPRWTPISAYAGVPRDIAYCLGEPGSTPTVPSTWSFIKGLYD
jgi:hypothetical protein